MSATTEKSSLVERVIAGDTRAVARAISKVEDGSEDAAQLMKDIFPHTGRGLVVGITVRRERESRRWSISWRCFTETGTSA